MGSNPSPTPSPSASPSPSPPPPPPEPEDPVEPCEGDEEDDCECDPENSSSPPTCPVGLPTCSDDSSEAPVRYANGEVQIAVTDLSAGGYGQLWQHRRIYSNRLTADGDLGNGTNWLVESWPYLAQYPDQYLEYDSDKRVTREVLDGGARSYTFAYTDSEHSEAYDHWKTKTVETRPDGSQHIVYTNHIGQILIKELRANSDRWIEYRKYDANGRQIERAQPSAVVDYDDGHADLDVTLQAAEGLIHVTDYYAGDDGGPAGRVRFQQIKRGSAGDAVPQAAFEYGTRTAGGVTVHPLAKRIEFRQDDGTGEIDTVYDYAWHSGSVQMQQRTTTLPAVPAAQNGSGTPATRVVRFDAYGNLVWVKDERGYLTRHTYDAATGARVQTIRDVDTSQVGDAPAGWTTPAGGGLHLVADYQHDAHGRLIQELGPWHTVDINGVATPVRTARWTVYHDAAHEIWTAAGYATGSAPNYTYTLVNPVSITKSDHNGNVLEQIQVVRANTSGKLQPSDSFPQSSYVRWTTYQYTDCCRLSSTRVYHTIPASGEGTAGTHYDQTDFGYDSAKRRNRSVSPGGTITFQVFDVHRHVLGTYVGTDDSGATETDPTGGGADPNNNMVLVTSYEYDNGQAGGDGNLNQQTQHVSDSETRVTGFVYDGLNRRITSHVDGGAPSNPTGIDTHVHYYHNSAWQILETRQSDTESAQPETLQPKDQYVWSQRYIDAVVLRDENTGANGLCDDQRLYYLNDANFNVTAVLDTAGDPVERYVYSPYGVVTIYDPIWTNSRSESSYGNLTLYSGRELDGETGLYYYRNRYYGAELGRFMSRDPIGYFTRLNLYDYVDNNPLCLTDPLGFVECNADKEGARRGVAGDTVFSPGDLNPDFAKMTINLMMIISALSDIPPFGPKGTTVGELLLMLDPNRTWGLDVAKLIGEVTKFEPLLSAHGRQATVWTMVQCEECRCTTLFQFFRGKRKWEWVPVGKPKSVQCDLSQTEWGKKHQKRAVSVHFVDEGRLLFDLLDLSEMSSIRQQCSEQAEKSCEK